MINKEVAETSLNGQERWSLVTKMPLCDERGEIIGTFGISRDITALKLAEQELVQYRDHLAELVKEHTAVLSRSNARLHAEIVDCERIEQALRTSEQQYRLLAENVPDGIVIVQNGRVAFSNAAFGNMAGYAMESSPRNCRRITRSCRGNWCKRCMPTIGRAMCENCKMCCNAISSRMTSSRCSKCWGSFKPSLSPVNAKGRALDMTLPEAIEALEKRIITDALANTGYLLAKPLKYWICRAARCKIS